MSVYQSLYRTVPSDDQLVPALATVMFFNNWTQLTMFTENQPQFTEVKPYKIITLCIYNYSLADESIAAKP